MNEQTVKPVIQKKAVKKKKAGKSKTDIIISHKPLQPTPMEMLDKLIEKSGSAEQLQIMFELHQQWEKNEARKEYVQAMAQFKQNPPEIKKSRHVRYQNRNGDWTDYHHADLDDIVAAVSEPLANAGINMDWSTDQGDGGRIKVTCILTHFLGHTKEVTLYGSPDDSGGKNNIQAVGSTVKYLQRYTAMAALGLSDSDLDNDGGDGRKTLAEYEAEPESSLPTYTDEEFPKKLEQWRKLINDGKKAVDVIVTVSTKYQLSEDQKQQILNLENSGE